MYMYVCIYTYATNILGGVSPLTTDLIILDHSVSTL